MAKILITGAAGFIGLHLAERLLADGHEVDLVDNFARGVRDSSLERVATSPRARLFAVDLLDPLALAATGEHQVIFHLAALVGVRHVLERPFDVLALNVRLLENVITHARRMTSLQRLVFASTSEVYAGTLQHYGMSIPTPETTPLALPDLGHPRTSYMLSKIFGEALCHHARVPFTIIRPHNVYGPRMGLAHVIPELLKKAHEAKAGGVIEVFSLEHRRTFCYIDDAVEFIVRAAFAEAAEGETLNVGNQAPELTMGQLAEVVVRTVQKRLTIAAGAVTPGSVPRRCPDMSRTIAITGHAPQVSPEEGLRRVYDWYRTEVFTGTGVSAQ